MSKLSDSLHRKHQLNKLQIGRLHIKLGEIHARISRLKTGLQETEREHCRLHELFGQATKDMTTLEVERLGYIGPE